MFWNEDLGTVKMNAVLEFEFLMPLWWKFQISRIWCHIDLYINTSFAEELFASIIKVVPRAALKDEAASSLK